MDGTPPSRSGGGEVSAWVWKQRKVKAIKGDIFAFFILKIYTDPHASTWRWSLPVELVWMQEGDGCRLSNGLCCLLWHKVMPTAAEQGKLSLSSVSPLHRVPLTSGSRRLSSVQVCCCGPLSHQEVADPHRVSSLHREEILTCYNLKERVFILQHKKTCVSHTVLANPGPSLSPTQ